MPHILVVTADFYQDIATELTEGAKAVLEETGNAFTLITLPGALEIPAAISMAIESGRYDGYVALGCVIRGETTHYDYVCSESARGLMDLSLRHHAAIGNGILTCEDKQQAAVRAARQHKNKGAVAARACLRMIEIKREMGVSGR